MHNEEMFYFGLVLLLYVIVIQYYGFGMNDQSKDQINEDIKNKTKED